MSCIDITIRYDRETQRYEVQVVAPADEPATTKEIAAVCRAIAQGGLVAGLRDPHDSRKCEAT